MRHVYVFKLEIEYPEGSQQPGWTPEHWPTPNRLGSFWRWVLPADRSKAFKWPKERVWLSSVAAYRRAWLLRSLGCSVVVRRSLRVQWETEPWTGSGGPLPPEERAA